MRAMADAGPSLFFRRARGVSQRSRLRSFQDRLRREVAGGAAFHCLVTDDAELRRLNRMFLGTDEPTDVLSFPSAAPDGFLGEIAISAETAGRQAAERGHSVEEEIGVLMLHGLLHLMGMDHERDGGRMRRAETGWRKRLGLPRALIERAGR